MNGETYHFVLRPSDARLLRELAGLLERNDAMVTVEVEEGVPDGDRLGSTSSGRGCRWRSLTASSPHPWASSEHQRRSGR